MASKEPFDFTNLFFIIPILALLFLELSAFQVFHNFYQLNVRAAGGWWYVLGTVLQIFGLVTIFTGEHTTGRIILGGVILVLGLCSFAGFNFSFA